MQQPQQQGYRLYREEKIGWKRSNDSSRLDSPLLRRYGKFGVYGAGAVGNQIGRPRPLAKRGIRGFEMCCAGMGLGANVGGPGCCPMRTKCFSTYQCRPPKQFSIAGRTAPPIPCEPGCLYQ